MDASSVDPPITAIRLKQIANDACQSALINADCYEHSKTEGWNNTIINSILRSLISESTPTGASSPSYKYAVNSTIIQHLIPAAPLRKSKPVSASTSTATGTEGADVKSEEARVEEKQEEDKNAHVGRTGMHCATAAYWNESTDGMWSFKYDGAENKGLDVVISVIWMST